MTNTVSDPGPEGLDQRESFRPLDRWIVLLLLLSLLSLGPNILTIVTSYKIEAEIKQTEKTVQNLSRLLDKAYIETDTSQSP